MTETHTNPCLSCGACCSTFRVSFYWTEAEPAAGGCVPPELTEKLNDFRAVMKGTNRPEPRCVALQGEVGDFTSCAIYENRPSPCREFLMALDDPEPDSACDRVRERWGLPRLKPLDPSKRG
ncbi:YkgJ family cysteine cluster protein [Thiofaba sp. EF100]|uniref:YkgJ family cysteine cluster protein n=1 Tax=Thiofaba sp. EF100 TaxID=3121274 RepID=UPI00322151DB